MKQFKDFRIPLFIAVAIVGLGLLITGEVSATVLPTVKPTPPKGPPDVTTTSEELTDKWFSQVEGEGWVYYSYKEESPGDNGVDPETGWPIPNQTLWEHWYRLDSQDQPITFLVRRTDLERGNVNRVVWQDDILLRDPSGVREEGLDWQLKAPLKDHFCHTWISRTLGFRGETIGEITSQWIEAPPGVKQWQVTMKLSFPPVTVADASGNNEETMVGTILTCTRNGETGAVESSEYFRITPGDGRVLIQRSYDHTANLVPEPPAEMLALLDQLAQP